MAKDYGNRPDGSKKGLGWLGIQERPDGGVSTEISIGVEIDRKETSIPLMVPGLQKMELQWLLSTPVEEIAKTVPESIMDKAVAHAKKRIAAGQSPFKD